MLFKGDEYILFMRLIVKIYELTGLITGVKVDIKFWVLDWIDDG